MKSIPLYKGTTGLNNDSDPSRLKYDPETGMAELASAWNVAINSTGAIKRRSGLTATARTENIHSLFRDGGDCFFVLGNALYRLNNDYSATGIRNDLTIGCPMYYCQILDRTYYCNGHQKGYIVDGTSFFWVAGDYVGPTTYRKFYDPPSGTFLTYHNGRIYVVQDTTAWYSEMFSYGWFDYASNYIPFGQHIKMFRGVSGGIYVGLEKHVVFLSGQSPKDFIFKVVSDSPVIEGSDVYAAGDQVGNGEATERAVIWTAKNGIYIGSANGQTVNTTRNRIVIPDTPRGSAVYLEGEYIVSFE